MENKRYYLLFFFLLLSCAIYSQQIENSGFEEWETVGNFKDEPVNWSTIKTCDQPSIASVAPVTWDISTDAHSGQYALKLFNLLVFNLSATGAICNGRFHAEFNLDSSYSYTEPSDPQWCLPFTARPDSLTGWFKFFPQGNDAAQFKAIVHVDECSLPEFGTFPNWVGMAVYVTPNGQTFDTWTRFSVPFTYYDNRTPEFLLCVMNSGDSTNSVPDSYLLVDDLELKYSASGIGEQKTYPEFITADGRRLTITLTSQEEFLQREFSLIDLSGQTTFRTILTGDQVMLPSSLTEGMYVAVLDGKFHRYAQKIMIR